jgi:hypothetical protein
MVVVVGSRSTHIRYHCQLLYVFHFYGCNDSILFLYEMVKQALNIIKEIFMSETINAVLDRIKNLKVFDVEVDIPEGFFFSGVIPFDATISQNKGIFKVYASTQEEADAKVNSYLTRNTEE